jgi:hypothetical protein
MLQVKHRETMTAGLAYHARGGSSTGTVQGIHPSSHKNVISVLQGVTQHVLTCQPFLTPNSPRASPTKAQRIAPPPATTSTRPSPGPSSAYSSSSSSSSSSGRTVIMHKHEQVHLWPNTQSPPEHDPHQDPSMPTAAATVFAALQRLWILEGDFFRWGFELF